MNVLSLFDGISCGRVALERANIHVHNYFASEIDQHAIKVSQANHTDVVQLGDINAHDQWDLPQIDLLIGGSPCQSISGLGDGTGLRGSSGLFYRFWEVMDKVKPKYFLLENVSGNRKAIDEISRHMGVEPIEINSNLVSGQNRKRLYWTNIPFDRNIEDKGITLKSILEPDVPAASVISDARVNWLLNGKGQLTLAKRYATIDGHKAQCLTARSDASWNSNYVTRGPYMTRLTPVEYERLQTLPDGYTDSIANTQRYKVLGNGWTVDVIAHILRGITR